MRAHGRRIVRPSKNRFCGHRLPLVTIRVLYMSYCCDLPPPRQKHVRKRKNALTALPTPPKGIREGGKGRDMGRGKEGERMEGERRVGEGRGRDGEGQDGERRV